MTTPTTPPVSVPPTQPAQAVGGEAKPAPGLVLPSEDAPDADAARAATTREPKHRSRRQVRVPRPIFVERLKQLVIPQITGVDYQVNGKTVSGSKVLDRKITVTAVARDGFAFREGSDESWEFDV